jgi:hypothetical protein
MLLQGSDLKPLCRLLTTVHEDRRPESSVGEGSRSCQVMNSPGERVSAAPQAVRLIFAGQTSLEATVLR